jgi:hypothetical protein
MGIQSTSSRPPFVQFAVQRDAKRDHLTGVDAGAGMELKIKLRGIGARARRTGRARTDAF